MDGIGLTHCFVISFKASKSGWGRPIKETLFGPFRDCIYPSSLRSKSVKKAIAIRGAIRHGTIEHKGKKNILSLSISIEKEILYSGLKSDALICHLNSFSEFPLFECKSKILIKLEKLCLYKLILFIKGSISELFIFQSPFVQMKKISEDRIWPVLRRSELSSCRVLRGEQPHLSKFLLLLGTLSQHRGAKLLCQYGLLKEISLLSLW